MTLAASLCFSITSALPLEGLGRLKTLCVSRDSGDGKFRVGEDEMRNRVEEIFHEVADLSAEARARYFTQQGIDTKTRIEVEALVFFDADRALAGTGYRAVAQRALARFGAERPALRTLSARGVLGAGRHGHVYLAERVDGEVAQRVAVKFLRPGADDPQLRQRFLAERQIPASLSHPTSPACWTPVTAKMASLTW